MLQNPYEENHKNLLTDRKEDSNKWKYVLPVSLSVIKMSVLSKIMCHFTPFQSLSQLGTSFFLFLGMCQIILKFLKKKLAGIARKFRKRCIIGDLHFQI